jgi:iron(III) transport system permease protein
MGLTMPTILAAALIVFMRAFADFGTPAIIGEGYKTFPVLIYDSFLSEVGADYNFASAVSVLAIILTGVVFLIQKFATNRFKFSINSLHPIQKKTPRGLSGFLMHAYCYVLIAVALLPQFYIVADSFGTTRDRWPRAPIRCPTTKTRSGSCWAGRSPTR